ncbi:MAG TPA: amidohydrolase family protein [Acidimicrobiales bacterium]|nr:amidohydrolase family protein [Acidimicrobiales bacterium]
MNVNVHSHVMTVESQYSAGDIGPTFTTDDNGFHLKFGPFERVGLKSVDMIENAKKVGMEQAAADWYRRFSDPTLRLAEMDEKGIDILGVTMSPIVYGYFLDDETGRRHARVQNEGLATYCQADPARLFFMATLPMQDPAGSAAEVDYAVGELGAKAINIAGSLLGGRELDDPALDAIWERVAAHDVPIFIHPSLHSSENETAFTKWAPILGYPYQETVAFTTILLGGILDRFPGLNFYITHGGGFAPYQFGRVERMADAYGYNHAERPLRDYLSNFYFDVLIHDVKARRFLVDWAGPDQVIVGDNYDGIDSATGFAFLDELGLPAGAREKIAGGNAVELFHLTALARAGR